MNLTMKNGRMIVNTGIKNDTPGTIHIRNIDHSTRKYGMKFIDDNVLPVNNSSLYASVSRLFFGVISEFISGSIADSSSRIWPTFPWFDSGRLFRIVLIILP
jgi:hypothetical protein